MRLGDVLKLPKEPHSLSIIKDFLNQPLNQHDYQAALSLYLDIAISLELFDMVYQDGKILLKEILLQNDTPYTEKILKSMIIASIRLSFYEDANEYIQQRRERLPMLKQYASILDEIEYKKALSLPIKEDLIRVLNDIIPDSVKIQCYQELFHIYYEENQYELALKTLYQLYNFDLRNEYLKHELRLLIQLNKLDEAIKIASLEIKKNAFQMDVLIALIECYMKKQEYHKASSLEAEYEELIDKESDDFRIYAYELLIELYKKLDNKLSMDLYQKKLKSIIKQSEKKVKKPLTDENKEIVYVERIQEKAEKKDLYKILDFNYEMLQFANQIDKSLLLRDYLRTLFIHADDYIKSKEYVLYVEDESPNFFHYKKERLYDKTIIKDHVLGTVVNYILESKNEVLEDSNTIKFPKNIITQNSYLEDIKFLYGFPIGLHGVLLIHIEDNVLDPGAMYDYYKIISLIIESHLEDEKKMSKIKIENRYYQNIINAPILAFRELREYRSTYNKEAMQLFGIDKHHHLELFLRDVSYENVKEYKETISRLLSKSGEMKELLYKYQEKNILEKLYSLRIGDEIVVMSLFFDQTKEVNLTNELIEKATIDQESGLANFYQFQNDLDQHLSDKSSLILIEMNSDLKHIYGTERLIQFFKEFSQHTKKFFQEGSTYRVDYHQLIVVLPYNDIRSVTKTIKDYLKYLENYESKILKYEKFNVNMGILRYPVVTVDKSIEKIMRYLDIALEKSKRQIEDKFVFFVYRDYEDELFEQQVIDHLNLAIEEKSLGLIFNQITDIKKNRVWQYESELILFNLAVDSKYLLKIAKKRNRLVDLERYHIKKVIEFLIELEKTTERLIKITIPISKETFLDPTFNPYLLGLLKEGSIPYEFIRIKFDMDLRANQYQNQIQELIDRGISIDTTSVDMALIYPFHALHVELKKESIKWNSYLTHLKTMLDGFQMALVIRNVKTKDQKEALERIGIQYVEGNIYKELPAPILIQKIKETL